MSVFPVTELNIQCYFPTTLKLQLLGKVVLVLYISLITGNIINKLR